MVEFGYYADGSARFVSETELENQLIRQLTTGENQWRLREDIKTEADLWENLRHHINRINQPILKGKPLTDAEFQRLRVEYQKSTATPFQAAVWLRGENGRAGITIDRDDASEGPITLELFNNKEINGGLSSYEVVHQVAPVTRHKRTGDRGDVTLLINGLPIIHIELKTQYAKDGYMQAFDQIKRYEEDGFFDGIYASTQVFVVSNKVATRYFARPSSLAGYDNAKKFLFSWRDPDNEPVEDLFEFARKALRVPEAHELISRFSLVVDDGKDQKFLMVLRPYQIHAIRRILANVKAHEGGFIWHATGSGKTVTSFVATKLLAAASIGVDRTIMLVDRKALDSQTKIEFTKFASEYKMSKSHHNDLGNSLVIGINHTGELKRNLLSKKNNQSIIVTTVQKLGRAVDAAEQEERDKFEKVRAEHFVFIVDECHRAVSDREMRRIKKIFPNSTWIGLTGTPIFDENKKSEDGNYARTTYDQYGPCLHSYTTKNAMDDKSVLQFQVEYRDLLTENDKDKITGDDGLTVDSIKEREVFESDEYITNLLQSIFQRRDIVSKFGFVNGKPTMSAILTTTSIPRAKRIYRELQRLKKSGELLTGSPPKGQSIDDPDFPRVAITYSVATDESEMNQAAAELAEVFADYEDQFGSKYHDPDLYNQNVNARLTRKAAQYKTNGQWLDLVIVVDRLLTGFDAPTIQTLYMDRDLRFQGLLQAFSRTNRVHSGKEIGMIATFRHPNLMRANVGEAMRLFSNDDRDWQSLVPKEYTEVKEILNQTLNQYAKAKQALEENPHGIVEMGEYLKAYNDVTNTIRAAQSYDEFQNEAEQATYASLVSEVQHDKGAYENTKAEFVERMSGDEPDAADMSWLDDLELNSTEKIIETIDSGYIARLLAEYQSGNKAQRKEFLQVIEAANKPPHVLAVYRRILDHIDSGVIPEGTTAAMIRNKYFHDQVSDEVDRFAQRWQIPPGELTLSVQQARPGQTEIQGIAAIVRSSKITKDQFAEIANGKSFFAKAKIITEEWAQALGRVLDYQQECTHE